MKLPRANQARVDESKVAEYLLARDHPDGGSKARFFERFGFHAAEWIVLSAALKEHGAVYLNGIGGAAQYYARTVQEVLDVNLTEFGIPEAMWHLRVHNFPAIVTMDSHGNSLHAEIEKATAEQLEELQTA